MILLNDLDLQESLIDVEGEGVLMLMQFVETNDLSGVEVLNLIHDLFVKGQHDFDQGNGKTLGIKLSKLCTMTYRKTGYEG